eukprot:scaffold30385_cov63-Cyclotella_meneghiniana.AAC.1
MSLILCRTHSLGSYLSFRSCCELKLPVVDDTTTISSLSAASFSGSICGFVRFNFGRVTYWRLDSGHHGNWVRG